MFRSTKAKYRYAAQTHTKDRGSVPPHAWETGSILFATKLLRYSRQVTQVMSMLTIAINPLPESPAFSAITSLCQPLEAICFNPKMSVDLHEEDLLPSFSLPPALPGQ